MATQLNELMGTTKRTYAGKGGQKKRPPAPVRKDTRPFPERMKQAREIQSSVRELNRLRGV